MVAIIGCAVRSRPPLRLIGFCRALWPTGWRSTIVEFVHLPEANLRWVRQFRHILGDRASKRFPYPRPVAS